LVPIWQTVVNNYRYIISRMSILKLSLYNLEANYWYTSFMHTITWEQATAAIIWARALTVIPSLPCIDKNSLSGGVFCRNIKGTSLTEHILTKWVPYIHQCKHIIIMIPNWSEHNKGSYYNTFYTRYTHMIIYWVHFNTICDWISENGSKSHIFISLYLLL